MKNARLWRLWLLIFIVALAVSQAAGRLWENHLENILGEEPSSIPIYNIYVGFNEETRGQWSPDDMDLLFEYRRQEGGSARAAQESMLPHLKDRLQSGINFPALFADKLMCFMGNDELGGYTYRFTHSELFVKLCMLICNCYYYLLLCLAALGILRRFRRLEPSVWLLLPLYTLGLSLAHMLVEVSSRYHYSIIPMIIIFAAFTLSGKEPVQKPLIKGKDH